MKYIIVLTDGAADYPVSALGNKTPLEIAKKPKMDELAALGEVFLVKTVPDDLKPGSDIANLSVMGYDPYIYYTGRSPLEAASIGLDLSPDDTSFRTNLVTLSDDDPYEEKTMVDYSSDEISTAEAKEIIETINEELKSDDIYFKSGVSYRHIMVWNNAPNSFSLTPPHDISDRKIKDHLPSDNIILDLMKKSSEILKNHEINKKRIERGLHPANSIWIWGEGKKPALSSFTQKYNISGSVISAVDLVKGLGICAGLDSIDVDGATGNIHSNLKGKADAAIDELLLKGKDFVYIHIEAPDECGHRGEIENKVSSIELIDEKIVAPVCEALENANEDYSIMILPDHPTPLATKTHCGDSVPCVIYRSNNKKHSGKRFTENDAASTNILITPGYTLMDKFLKG